MNAENALAALLDALNNLGVAYMLVGSMSSNFYGVPRSTKDADVVVNLQGSTIGAIAKRLGSAFRLNPQAAFETVTSTTKYVFDLPEIPFTIEVFLLSDDEHDQERFRRRKPVQLFGRTVFVPTAEDVVVMKLRWAAGRRPGKDVDDIRNVIAVSGKSMDWPYVHSWCDRHGTRELLDSIRASIPPM